MNLITPHSKFKIQQVFSLTERNLLVVSGNLISGEIDNTMFLLIKKNGLRIKIHSVEAVIEGVSNLGLTFLHGNDDEVAELKSLQMNDVVLCVR